MKTPVALGQRVIRALVGLVLALGTPVASLANQSDLPVLTAGYIQFPPLAYTDEQGQAQGRIIELTNELAAASGFRVEWKRYPINRIYHYLETGDIDLWPGSPGVPALSRFTVESSALDINVKLCAFALEGTPKVSSLQDLSRHDLVLIRGYTYREQLNRVIAENHSYPIVAPDHIAAMELLLRGRAQYLISYGHPMQRAMRHYPLQGTRCDQLDEWPLVYVISRRNPDALQLAETLDSAFLQWREANPQPPMLRGVRRRLATTH